MVSSVLWISAGMLAFTCLLMPGSGYLTLHEGEKCGAWIEGACEHGLICLSSETHSDEFYAEGLCTRPSYCNCSEFQCPPHRRRDCRGGRVIDPCGCCSHCAKRNGQVCGGPSWRYGYCDRGSVCTPVVGLAPVRAPQLGVCQDIPVHLKNTFLDITQCPIQYGCNVHVGNCDCYSSQTCQLYFSYITYEACNKEHMEFLMYDFDQPAKVEKPVYKCTEWRCEVQGCECVCQQKECDYLSPLLDEAACCNILRESGCQNTTCPKIPTPPCPEDSFISEPHTEPGQCCPAVPGMCTCNYRACAPKPKYCIEGGVLTLVVKATGHPGNCCDRYECVKE